jgi:replicative DNA helicase
MGKSALAVQIARHVAETSGGYVPLLSYEMSSTEILMRMLSTSLGYDLLRLRNGDIPSGMERDMAVAAQKMAELTMFIDDNPPETIGGVRSAMRRLARRGPISAIVIDYLQLMSGESRHASENRTQEVSEISRGLKRLATELNVPVIALSQLNRQLEQRPNKRPSLSDLRESGSLEQDANAVLFLYREHVYNAAADAGAAELIIAKQRNGPLGTVRLRFDGSCARLTEDSSQQGFGSGYTPPAPRERYQAHRNDGPF